MRRVGLYGLFFLSGASALMYELVWQRLLNLVFGVSTLSVSAVLAAFMGGLALGGLLFGRLADRVARPLRLYAWLEAGIGATALLVPVGFAALTGWYTALASQLEPGHWGGAGLRLVLSLLVLAGPATLIGATLPVMGRLAARRGGGLTGTFSLLYGVNTLGGVLGAALTGFVLLHYLGMQWTLGLAVCLNFLVALGAVLLARGGAEDEGERPVVSRPEPASSGPWLALGLAAITGATCTGLEVVWTRILGILTSNSAYGFALILTVVLLGLGLGGLIQALWASRERERPENSWHRLAWCQFLLAGFTLAAAPFYHTTPEWLQRCSDGSSVTALFLGEFALTAGALFVPAVCMGMALPLLAAAASDRARFASWLGRLYAVNTFGCVLGAFGAGFVLIPWLGIRAALVACVAASVAVGLAARLRAARPPVAAAWVGGAAAVLAAAVWLLVPSGGYYKSSVEAPRRLLYYREGDNATVAVVEEPDGTRGVLVDGQPVAGTGGTSVVDQKMLAHLPLLLHPDPHRALTVGFGSGGTSHSMTLHGVEVDCVEIESKVPGAADCFRSENDGVLSHHRFRLVLDDARSWLRVAPVRYDAVVTDCTNIQYRSNGDLYTVEYFRLMKDRLTSDGVAAAWVPANGIHDDDLKTLIRSFREVFPHTSVWYMNSLATDFVIVVGTPDVLSVDLDQWRRRMSRPAVAADLAAVGLADPRRLAYTLLTAEEATAEYVGPGPLNTDDRPVLSYSTYGAGYQDTIAENLIRLAACRVDAARFVRNPPPGDAMLRCYAASTELLLGHIKRQMGSKREALAHYVSGARLLPEDGAMDALVRWAWSNTPEVGEESEAPAGK